ncbi:hypothetical protein ACIBCN_41240 [Nocardia sp. NPDC051052]|uniref:hypothetical protein n=1 Tax=Nocardia sp. NPDC051052 TaxID=3364322 RepID=UPI00379EEA95
MSGERTLHDSPSPSPHQQSYWAPGSAAGGLGDNTFQRTLGMCCASVPTDRGTALGRATREQLWPGRLGTERALTLLCSVLGEQGFEPARVAPDHVRLRNCPFHPLAAQAPELVCGLNHAYLSGILIGLRADTVSAVLAPQAGQCCVELRPAT